MGFGGSGDGIFGVAKKILQKPQVVTPKPADNDLTSPEAVAVRQRQAQKMREGLNEAFGVRDPYGRINPRGTDIPQNLPPPPGYRDPNAPPRDPEHDPSQDPIITDDRPPPKTEAERQQREREERNKRYRDRTGKGGDERPVIGP